MSRGLHQSFATHLKRPRYALPLVLACLSVAALGWTYATVYATRANSLKETNAQYDAKRTRLMQANQQHLVKQANAEIESETRRIRRMAFADCKAQSFDRILQQATETQKLDLVSGAAQDTLITEGKAMRFEHQRRTLSLKGTYADTAAFLDRITGLNENDGNDSSKGLIAVRRLRMNLVAKGVYSTPTDSEQVATSLVLSRFCQTPLANAPRADNSRDVETGL